MKSAAELLSAIASLLWPIFAGGLLYFLFPYIKNFLSRDKVTIKFGGMEISAEQATQSLANQVADLQNKILEVERKFEGDKKNPELRDILELPIRRGEKQRILWVDDSPSNNAIQIQKLMNDGLWVDVASVTLQALEMLKYTQYDLIISDLGRVENGVNLPEAGLMLTREVRKLNISIPIIIFSSPEAVERYEAGARESGVNYITTSTMVLYRLIEFELGGRKHAD